MPFQFSQRSQALLLTVKPNLRAVAQRAIELTEVDFGVVQGNRTLEQQRYLYGQGRTAQQLLKAGLTSKYARPDLPRVTWTLNSNHIGGNAIDVMPYVDGVGNWDNDGRLGLWPPIAAAFARAAKDLAIPIVWGGSWTKTPDRPHFELAQK